MHYIKWVSIKYTEKNPRYLGRSLTRDHLSTVPSLQCEYKEADNRLMLHIDDLVRYGYERVIIALSDTDIFVKVLFHYAKCICIYIYIYTYILYIYIYINLQEL